MGTTATEQLKGTPSVARVDPGLANRIGDSTAFNAAPCMNCGVCTATCPLGLEVLPRRLLRFVMLGMEDRVRENAGAIYSCLLCRMCEESCPAGVPIAENVRSLRRYLNREVFRISAGRPDARPPRGDA
ncbi:MAG: 4Fe-4S dicluster domain-containing protein [Firmicutes bacterium]|nr:4Fe-4S dicluster domain-containing protein [Bacillota bacterium]